MRILVLVLTFFFITGCENSLCGIEEVERVSNQAGKVDFVYIHKNCGATASTATQVFIVAKGKSIKDQKPLFIADKVEYFQVKWDSPQNLKISFKGARIFQFSNFWQSKDVDNFNYLIKISLLENT